MKAPDGYLIVLTMPESSNDWNQAYQGIDRVPAYRFHDQEPIQEEIEAMNEYILGDVRNEIGLIESFETAKKLYGQLGKTPLKFAIIWCCDWQQAMQAIEAKKLAPMGAVLMGFDVATLGGDYWSIVGDFPNDERFAEAFCRLNKYGLFSEFDDAEKYLHEYRSLKVPNHDSLFRIVEVFSL